MTESPEEFLERGQRVAARAQPQIVGVSGPCAAE
jgi:hypothetical protein